jgi:cell division protein FtsQ
MTEAKGARPLPLVDLPLNDSDEPPFLRPRSRARLRRTRRGTMGRAILIAQVGGGVLVTLLLLWTGYTKVMASERLKVARVTVRGSRFLSEAEVRELLGPAVGENILGLDIAALTSRLRASPWVADANVGRNLPDTLRVEIQERVPLALAEVERLYLMDAEGALVDVYGPRTAGFNLPIVRGLGDCDAEARRDRAQRAGTLLRDLGDLATEVSEVQGEPGGELRVVLRGAGEVLLMGTPPYRKRFVTFLGLRKELSERCPDAEYFDLRFRDRIYAKGSLRRDASGPREDAQKAAPSIAPAPAADDVVARMPPDRARAPRTGREPQGRPEPVPGSGPTGAEVPPAGAGEVTPGVSGAVGSGANGASGAASSSDAVTPAGSGDRGAHGPGEKPALVPTNQGR